MALPKNTLYPSDSLYPADWMLITDRTKADVDYVAVLRNKIFNNTATTIERNLWNMGIKGAYNYVDLNRVGTELQYLKNLLNEMGDNLFPYTPVTNWSVSDIMTPVQASEFLTQIYCIYQLCVYAELDVPEPPTSMNNFSYTDANNIELILQTFDDYLQSYLHSQ